MQPVYLLLDTSGSMRGEAIAAVNVGLASMVAALRSRPGLGERVHLSIVTFDAEVKEVVPLQAVSRLHVPTLTVPSSGPTFIGAALEHFLVQHARAPRPEGTLPAMLMLMTDGSPTDLQIYEEAIPKVKRLGLAKILAFAAGPKARSEPLLPLADEVIALATLDGPAFARMFDHVAQTIGGGASGPSLLPPPPSNLQVVL
jgi:uncharacterized protein YegL